MQDDTQQDDTVKTERMLCHNCMAPNPVEADFCGECNTPLSAHAAYDPLMQITASGDTYIKATQGRPSWIKTIGIILIFGPVSLYGLMILMTLKLETLKSFPGLVTFVLYLAQFLIGAFVVLKVLIRTIMPPKPNP